MGNSRKRKETHSFVLIPALLGLLLCVGLILYPLISNYLYQKKAGAVFTEQLEKREPEWGRQEEWNRCLSYNERLLAAGKLPQAEKTEAEERLGDEYKSLLSEDTAGLMGYLRIPSLNLTAPIYHGTTADSLERGVGHVEGSSLPVGGADSHCALAAHTGSRDKILFSDLGNMKEGDLFYLLILDRLLAYRVFEIRTVLPYEIESIAPREGEELCTLITCTPYGINSHRLLVTGRRDPSEELRLAEKTGSAEQPAAASEQTGQGGSGSERTESEWMRNYRQALVRGLELSGGFLILYGGVLLAGRRKKRPE